MNLQKQLKTDMISAMKSKEAEKLSLLRVIIGEINKIGKEVSDDEIIKILKKMNQNAIEMNNQDEVDIIKPYLPTMLTAEQLDEIIKNIISTNSYSGMGDMGKIMKELRDRFGSSYDGKLASNIVKANF